KNLIRGRGDHRKVVASIFYGYPSFGRMQPNPQKRQIERKRKPVHHEQFPNSFHTSDLAIMVHFLKLGGNEKPLLSKHCRVPVAAGFSGFAHSWAHE
ncbi:MAG: hypothetical protein U0176_25190, partial [Bacteroidia bacterium]